MVWRGPWLGIEPGTSRTRSQHSTTRLSRRRLCASDSSTLAGVVQTKCCSKLTAYKRSKHTTSYKNRVQSPTRICHHFFNCTKVTTALVWYDDLSLILKIKIRKEKVITVDQITVKTDHQVKTDSGCSFVYSFLNKVSGKKMTTVVTTFLSYFKFHQFSVQHPICITRPLKTLSEGCIAQTLWSPK